jgi:hypothetical protein
MQVNTASIGMLRGALFAGPVIFGVVALMLQGSPEHEPADASTLSAIRIAAYALIPAACIALMVLRSFRASAPIENRAGISLAGWGVAEAGAIVGAVLIYLGGEMWAWLAGLAVMIVSWLLLPADPKAE